MFLVLTTSICLRTKWVPRDNENHKVKQKASSNWRASETLLWISRQERVTHEQPRLEPRANDTQGDIWSDCSDRYSNQLEI
jgi:hypothetical protein